MIINKIASSKFLDLIKKYPEARIVTDVGSSMISGWGDLQDAKYHEEHQAIELIFD